MNTSQNNQSLKRKLDDTQPDTRNQKRMMYQLISDLVDGSDKTLANEFVKQVKGNVVVVCEKEKNGYVWNETTKLWNFHQYQYLSNLVGEYLEPIIEKCINYLQTEGAERKAVEDLQKALAKVRSNTDMKHIFDVSINKLIDDKFSSKLDQNMDLVPIENQKVVVLKPNQENETRERTKEDLFTFECSDFEDKLGLFNGFLEDWCTIEKDINKIRKSFTKCSFAHKLYEYAYEKNTDYLFPEQIFMRLMIQLLGKPEYIHKPYDSAKSESASYTENNLDLEFGFFGISINQ